jgi:hypothetical protein
LKEEKHMKRIYTVASLFSMLSFCAAAQTEGDKAVKMKAEAERLMAQVKTMSLRGMVTGPAVKGAPYSAVEISEHNQVLGDGTRIHSEQQTNVYRDSEGRVRRETPDEITITDPVAGTSYVLNPKDHSARRAGFKYTVVNSTSTSTGESGNMITVHTMGPAVERQGSFDVGFATEAHTVAFKKRDAQPGESLGKQTIEGVVADGTRHVETIEVGAIGNDRAIQVVNESWYSPDLQMVVKSAHSDPRGGDESFRLTNIVRAEPPANLFTPPAEYKLPPLPVPDKKED